jgi:hypothetical protein
VDSSCVEIDGSRRRVRRLLGERLVRPMVVVVADVFGEHGRHVPLTGDQHPVGALAARTVPTQRSATAFARGACGGVRITRIPAAVNTASKYVQGPIRWSTVWLRCFRPRVASVVVIPYC